MYSKDTKTYRISLETYRDLKKLGTLADTFDSVIKDLLNGHKSGEFAKVSLPRFTTWIVKMWHFGIDSLDEYDKKEFHVTFEEGVSDLFRIYTKRMKNQKVIVRAERQEYPNQDFITALVKKLYPDGRLVNN